MIKYWNKIIINLHIKDYFLFLFIMSDLDETNRLNLKEMIKKSDVENTTDKIRELQHSDKIRADVNTIVKLKKQYSRLDKKMLNSMIEKKCVFIRENYFNIYNKIIKDNIDLGLLNKFLTILKKIELGDFDQHEASVMVGKILKEIYIDSALREDKKRESNSKTKVKKMRSGKSISWNEYKMIQAVSQTKKE